MIMISFFLLNYVQVQHYCDAEYCLDVLYIYMHFQKFIFKL